MAKVGAPITVAIRAPIMRNSMVTIKQKGQRTVRKAPHRTERFKRQSRQQQDFFQDILRTWHKLKVWKKIRWSICALKYEPSSPPIGTAKFHNGWSLFYQEWRTQGIIKPHQPISPCSRRLTDPTASPWDYTP